LTASIATRAVIALLIFAMVAIFKISSSRARAILLAIAMTVCLVAALIDHANGPYQYWRYP
jgi:hypothetical protein